MKLNKIALALFAITAAPLAANAGVTISPLLLGYHYSEGASDEQAETMGAGGLYKENGLYTGAALGVELTPSTQFQVEYGVSNTDAVNDAGTISLDAEQEMISGNFLIGFEEFSGYTDNAFKPYVLVGAGQSKIEVEDAAGNFVTGSKDTIGNLGLGAMYRINDALSLRGEARAIHNFDEQLVGRYGSSWSRGRTRWPLSAYCCCTANARASS
jgi:OOP family OmpA-OmpF porin